MMSAANVCRRNGRRRTRHQGQKQTCYRGLKRGRESFSPEMRNTKERRRRVFGCQSWRVWFLSDITWRKAERLCNVAPLHQKTLLTKALTLLASAQKELRLMGTVVLPTINYCFFCLLNDFLLFLLNYIFLNFQIHFQACGPEFNTILIQYDLISTQ